MLQDNILNEIAQEGIRTHRHKDTRTPRHLDTVHGDSMTPRSRDTETASHRKTEPLISSVMQECKIIK